MNERTLDYLMQKLSSRSKSKEDYRDSKDYEDSRRDMRDSRYDKGHGNVDFEGSMDFRDYRDSERPFHGERYEHKDYRDYRDYHKSPRLSKTDLHHWKQMLENEDGTHGPHYDMQQIMAAADKSSIRFDDFDEKEFFIAVNMMYSDYCKVAKKYVAPDKELMFFADLAKAFLEDEDGPDASEKLALYFHCIVDA